MLECGPEGLSEVEFPEGSGNKGVGYALHLDVVVAKNVDRSWEWRDTL